MRKIDQSLFSERVLKLRDSFSSRIVGQYAAIDAFTRTLENFLGGFADPRRPLGSILFLGPTGTGKTSAVEALAEGLFGSRDACLKIDCGEFQHSHEIAKLIGSPPGYLGHQATPARLNQDAVNKFQTVDLPINIILFDEIEKADDTVWHLLLNILDKGLLTLGTNEVTNFTHSIIVMTSNVGATQMATISGENNLGFQAGPTTVDDRKMKDVAVSAAKKQFTPEFMNRLDEIVMFNTLTRTDVKEIMALELGYLQSRLFAKMATKLCPSPAALKEILHQGYDITYNARNLRRVIEQKIMLPIARAISTKQVHAWEDVVVDVCDGEFTFHAVASEVLGAD